jgi:hypothetical protein
MPVSIAHAVPMATPAAAARLRRWRWTAVRRVRIIPPVPPELTLAKSQRSIGFTVLCWLLRLLFLLPVGWAAAALWFDGPASRSLAGGLAVAFAAASLGLLFVLRPFRRGLLFFVLLFLPVLLWWRAIEPSNDGRWMADVEQLPRAEVVGDRVTFHNVRNCRYVTETDYDARWETRSYDLSAINGLDLFLCYWGPREIAHTIMSWDFADGQHLVISIETRKQVGQEYSAIKGFFRQYELYYVVADERDLIGVRTDYRGEDVYLYRLRTPPERAREFLLQYIDKINGLVAQPVWYNALTHNCTTVIFENVRPVVGYIPFDWRILANGRIDEMLYEQGVINRSLPFESLRERSGIDTAARKAGASDDFSALIRVGLPQRPPPPR